LGLLGAQQAGRLAESGGCRKRAALGALRQCGACKESVAFRRYQDLMAIFKGLLIFGA
jgi:hypothetical protein